mgnify:FL=1|tara:strand:+ start:123 stop:578 length:456 start_codon:yes stop_codon:yes gene_type:complete
MARFTGPNDITLFKHFSEELVEDIVTTTIQFFKLSIHESRTNLYGESLGKQYLQGVSVNALIERQESEANYEGFGFDRSQQVEYRFNRHTLDEKELYPEIGDVIFHNNGYFEIDNVREDYMLAGRTDSKFSIICSTFMTRRSQLNIEQRAV